MERELLRRAIMPKPPSLSHRIVFAILASRIHGVLSGAVLRLSLRGRRSGRTIVLPVMYAVDDEALVIVAAHASKKRWWRNLVDPARVEVCIAGVERSGVGRVLEGDRVARGRAIRAYLQRFPRACASFGVDRTAPISDAALGAAGHDFVVVRVDLEAGTSRGAATTRGFDSTGRPIDASGAHGVS